MRDLHFDEGFLRDFNQASKSWSWATWHQVEAHREAVARRLLDEVFGGPDGEEKADGEGEGEPSD
jgi:hypothetical protein